MVLLLCAGLCATAPRASAQFFRRLGFGGAPGASEVTATLALEPRAVVVGQPAAFVLSCTVPKDATVESDFRIGGLPDADDARLLYGEGFENLADGVSTNREKIVKRFRLPVRFLAPMTQTVTAVVSGMLTTHSGNGTSFSFSSSHNFMVRASPCELRIENLRTRGRPLNFTGAIGERYRLAQTASATALHPGDLITMTYALAFDGYAPTNVFPAVERLSPAFKAYEMKEIARSETNVVWTQVLVPRTVAATNTALVSFNYYNLRLKRYETVRAAPVKLTFVSDQKASTRNTSVAIDTGSTSAAPATVLELRFAPSEKSPVVAVLPLASSVKELSRVPGWRRVAVGDRIGWTR